MKEISGRREETPIVESEKRRAKKVTDSIGLAKVAMMQLSLSCTSLLRGFHVFLAI